MYRRRAACFVGGILILAACSDRSQPPTAPAVVPAAVLAPSQPPDSTLRGVGTLGTVDEVKPQEQGLVLYQIGFDFVPAHGAKYREVTQEFAVGARHNKLQVHIDDSTKIYLRDSLKTLSDLRSGDTLLVVGRVTGASLHAEMITDVVAMGPPPANVSALLPPGRRVATSHPLVSAAPAAPTSLCMGQDLDYSDPSILEFQGCWGGPSAADDLNTPFIPLMCPFIGCFGIDRFSYNMALAGWGYAFPFRFAADALPGLVYHVPGTVALQVEPLPATVGSFSFWGGLGFDVGLNIDFCSFFGCYDIYTFHLSAFTTSQEATGAGPLTGQSLDIVETSCPSIGIIPIEGIPIDPLSLGLCEDLGLTGQPFNATVSSRGASPSIFRDMAFGPGGSSVILRPDSMAVGVRFDTFGWTPDLTMGLYFRLRIFGATVYNTPTIPFGSGRFDAITTPFPLPGSVFSVATDPLSPVPDLWYLFQPTVATAWLSVAPAPTALTLVSTTFLVEGTPVVAHLTEAYDGSPITGRLVTFDASGLGGTASVSATGTTDGAGNAAVLLPVGEFTVTARYGGAATYLPSTASAAPVYVYRPTTFVVWAGNPGGVAPDGRYLFWGNGWAKQVVGGDYRGNASFKGFAASVLGEVWTSPPANSAPGPEEVPDLIGVILTTQVSGRGSWATGNVAGYAVLRVENPSGYRPDGGHETWGVMRALLP